MNQIPYLNHGEEIGLFMHSPKELERAMYIQAILPISMEQLLNIRKGDIKSTGGHFYYSGKNRFIRLPRLAVEWFHECPDDDSLLFSSEFSDIKFCELWDDSFAFIGRLGFTPENLRVFYILRYLHLIKAPLEYVTSKADFSSTEELKSYIKDVEQDTITKFNEDTTHPMWNCYNRRKMRISA